VLEVGCVLWGGAMPGLSIVTVTDLLNQISTKAARRNRISKNRTRRLDIPDLNCTNTGVKFPTQLNRALQLSAGETHLSLTSEKPK
jgi:hypothetical protein